MSFAGANAVLANNGRGKIDNAVRQKLSGYEAKYRKHLFFECRDFDVKGLTTQGG